MAGRQDKEHPQDECRAKLMYFEHVEHVDCAAHSADGERGDEIQDGEYYARAHHDYEHRYDVECAKCTGVDEVLCVQLSTALGGGSFDQRVATMIPMVITAKRKLYQARTLESQSIR